MTNVTFESTSPETARITLTGELGERTDFLPLLNAEDWPEAESTIPVEEADSTFLNSYRRAKPFASTDVTRAVLNGVRLEAGAKGHSLVATDGHRLCAIHGLKLPMNHNRILPLSEVLTWNKFPDECRVGFTDQHFRVEAGPWSVQGRTIDGQFPNWKQVIPAPQPDECVLEIAEEDIPALKEAVRNLPSPNGDLKETAITLMNREGVPVLASRDPQGNWALRHLRNSTLSGREQTAFNRKFFMDAVDSGFRTWRFVDDTTPLRADSADGTHVLMPIRQEVSPPKMATKIVTEKKPIILKNEEPMTEPNETQSEIPEFDVLDLATNARDQCRDLTLRDLIKQVKADSKTIKALQSELQNAKGVLTKPRYIAA